MRTCLFYFAGANGLSFHHEWRDNTPWFNIPVTGIWRIWSAGAAAPRSRIYHSPSHGCCSARPAMPTCMCASFASITIQGCMKNAIMTWLSRLVRSISPISVTTSRPGRMPIVRTMHPEQVLPVRSLMHCLTAKTRVNPLMIPSEVTKPGSTHYLKTNYFRTDNPALFIIPCPHQRKPCSASCAVLVGNSCILRFRSAFALSCWPRAL